MHAQRQHNHHRREEVAGDRHFEDDEHEAEEQALRQQRRFEPPPVGGCTLLIYRIRPRQLAVDGDVVVVPVLTYFAHVPSEDNDRQSKPNEDQRHVAGGAVARFVCVNVQHGPPADVDAVKLLKSDFHEHAVQQQHQHKQAAVRAARRRQQCWVLELCELCLTVRQASPRIVRRTPTAGTDISERLLTCWFSSPTWPS